MLTGLRREGKEKSVMNGVCILDSQFEDPTCYKIPLPRYSGTADH